MADIVFCYLLFLYSMCQTKDDDVTQVERDQGLYRLIKVLDSSLVGCSYQGTTARMQLWWSLCTLHLLILKMYLRWNLCSLGNLWWSLCALHLLILKMYLRWNLCSLRNLWWSLCALHFVIIIVNFCFVLRMYFWWSLCTLLLLIFKMYLRWSLCSLRK